MTEATTPIAPQYEDALQPGAARPLPSVEPPAGLKLPLDWNTAREFFAPAYCASLDRTRPILTGCYIEHGATRTVCVGTDTYRLHAVQLTEDAGQYIKYFEGVPPFAHIVPARPLMKAHQKQAYVDCTLETCMVDDEVHWRFTRDTDTERTKHPAAPWLEGAYVNFPKVLPPIPGNQLIAQFKLTETVREEATRFAELLKATKSCYRCALREEDGQLQLYTGRWYSEDTGEDALTAMTLSMRIPTEVAPQGPVTRHLQGVWFAEHIALMATVTEGSIMRIYAGSSLETIRVCVENKVFRHLYLQMPMGPPKKTSST
ncbi:MAG: hypothetical protein WC145_09455 [Aliarcobacter sp.]|jgi:hypothetical protein